MNIRDRTARESIGRLQQAVDARIDNSGLSDEVGSSYNDDTVHMSRTDSGVYTVWTESRQEDAPHATIKTLQFTPGEKLEVSEASVEGVVVSRVVRRQEVGGLAHKLFEDISTKSD